MVLADKRTRSLSRCSFITLITYQFSFLLFACRACPRVSLCSPTLAPRTLLAYQHTWLSLFLNLVSLLLPSHQSFSFLMFNNCFLTPPPPPGSCHPLFTFPYPFHLPDLLQPACFSACLLSVWPLLSLRLGELDWRGCGRSAALLTPSVPSAPYPDTGSKHVNGPCPPERRP